jgi:cytochrome c553
MRNMQYPVWILIALAVGLLLAVAPPFEVNADQDLAEKTGEVCTVCHDKPGSKLLTDKGKYYEAMETFEGYDDVLAIFGECTHCHVRKPGSTKLTLAGRKFSEAIENLEAFQEFLKANHPSTLAEDLGVEAQPE